LRQQGIDQRKKLLYTVKSSRHIPP
jgi:hypothetical protein